jgi:hypothetical protein
MTASAPSRWTPALFAFVFGTIFGLALAAGGYVAVSRALCPTEPSSPPPPVFARDDFSRRVMGKSEEEVLAAVGRPDVTSDDGGTLFWHFKNRTRDPITESKDTDVQVVIKEGKVVNINF